MGALAQACRAILEKPVPGDPKNRTYAQAIAERLAELALKGHSSSIRELADRAEGRATAKHRNSTGRFRTRGRND